jgi:polysaccharide biosynthesis/export protein VpsN
MTRSTASPALGRRALLVLLGGMLPASLVWSCGPRVDNSRVKLPAPVQSTTLGPGDLFTLEVVGEKDLPREFQVASDGTVDFPYVHRLQVEGLEPQELARTVRERLIEKRILTDPSVVVSVKEYNSKRVTVLGEVRKPGSFPLTTGMTLVQAISDAGGLSAIANGDRVNLTRKDKGSSTTVVLSFDSITAGKSPDIPLQAGDQIFVNERVF